MFKHPSENEPTNTRDIHSPDADICMNTTNIIQLLIHLMRWLDSLAPFSRLNVPTSHHDSPRPSLHILP